MSVFPSYCSSSGGTTCSENFVPMVQPPGETLSGLIIAPVNRSGNSGHRVRMGRTGRLLKRATRSVQWDGRPDGAVLFRGGFS